MDERLSRSNRLPGSEKLTRPEEIGQLSKYLKSIKEVYDESTRLEDQVLGITGYSTGKIPTIDSLEKKFVKAPKNQGEKVDLSSKILGVPGKKWKEKLEGKKVELKDNRETKLNNEKVKTPDNQGGEVSRLEEVIKKIQDVRNQSLSNKKIDLLDERNIALENTRLDLQAMINTSLENKRINLKDERETKLGDTKLGLTDNRQVELEDKVIGLKEPEEIKLGDKRLDIQDDGVESLENKRIDLSAEENIELEKKRVDIYDEQNPELSDVRLNLKDDRNVGLENKKIELRDDREIGLTDKRLNIKDENNPSLSNKIIGLEDDRDSTLSDTRIDLKDDRNTELEDTRLNLTDDRENELEDTRIELTDSREINLSDKILGLFDEREPKLEDTRLDIRDDRETSLSDKILELGDTREPELEDKKIGLKDERETTLSDKILELRDSREIELEKDLVGVLENENGEPTELYDSMLVAPENVNGEPTELYDSILAAPDNENREPENLSDKILRVGINKGGEINELEDKRLELEDNRETSLSDKILGVTKNENTNIPDLTNATSIKDYTSKLSDSELYEFAMKLASEGDNGSGETDGWLQKMESLMSAYLSSDILTPKRAIEFRDAVNNSLEMSYFGSQAALRIPVDTSSGTIWAKAEEMVGEQLTGTNRRDALDEMIVKLVHYTKEKLPRLPGSDLVNATKAAIKNVTGIVTGNSEHKEPMNKPLHMNGQALPGGYGDTLYQAANNRTSFNSIDKVGDTIGTVFYDRYWSSKSFKMTLEDLCPLAGKAPVVSFAELKALLKASPYITTPGKFMTDTKGSYNAQTLDTNMYWEVVIEPFCSSSGNCNNGGFSYLPSIKEINYENKKIHKVSTGYGFWAPISGFELQKSKLVTKSLPLYEGEISYPVGMEFTNELRLTFVDDSWKSWRRYFEKCAQVATFNSYPHKSNYYSLPITEREVTVIDKTNICIAPYKNIAFNIRIYILNPQFNTLKKYNLLCILKDFSEEYVGDIDSGGTDLNVSFSIVGENPEENKATKLLAANDMRDELLRIAALETQKRVTGAINSSIGLL